MTASVFKSRPRRIALRGLALVADGDAAVPLTVTVDVVASVAVVVPDADVVVRSRSK
jgi:hypothetical protein